MLEENNYDTVLQSDHSESEKTPFYYRKWWLLLWSLLLWPIGLFMLWAYFANMKKNELPRTNIVKDDFEDILKV
ncbi:hypothetical protein [Acetobacterium bakii]|uniref:Uncharacterized protein n=1 Tax=Acetobacterium bakii TaxID=52689 RepID=A0A0L6U3H1_9FIRM|nr:hypothetical protein [Acetobacterium bakii]KNZ43066.1 hypothetical protein AKG39_02615 [Acetobacterium bakii]